MEWRKLESQAGISAVRESTINLTVTAYISDVVRLTSSDPKELQLELYDRYFQ